MNEYGPNGTKTLSSWRLFVVTTFIATNMHIAMQNGFLTPAGLVLFMVSIAMAIVSLVIFFDDNRREDK